jgi:phosphate transport system protein
MTKHFQNEIDRLKKKILHLAALAEESLSMALRAVTNNDSAMVEKLQEADRHIDAFEIEVEEECLKILALHQPVAADLRYVVAVLKINNDLERIADMAVNITKRAKYLDPEVCAGLPVDLNSMLTTTLQMVSKSVDSLVNHDVALAYQVQEDDDAVDQFHKATYEAVYEGIKGNPSKVKEFISLLSVSRNLERIADHATNIAEDVIYMIEGDIVRHGGGANAAQSQTTDPNN